MPLPACKPGIPDGNQAGPVAVETACPLRSLKPFKTAPRKTGPPIMPVNTGGCKLLIGRMFTAGRPNLNGTGASAGVVPGRARKTAEGAGGRLLRGARSGQADQRSALPSARGLCSRPTVGSTLRRFGPGPRAGYFFFGAIIMTICRPSRRGRDSITMSSPRSPSIRLAISRPSS